MFKQSWPPNRSCRIFQANERWLLCQKNSTKFEHPKNYIKYRCRRVISWILLPNTKTNVFNTLKNRVHSAFVSHSDRAVLYTSFELPIKTESSEFNTFYKFTELVHSCHNTVCTCWKKSTKKVDYYSRMQQKFQKRGTQKWSIILWRERKSIKEGYQKTSIIPIERQTISKEEKSQQTR